MVNLILVDSFFDDINREGCFDTADMDGINMNYRIVFASNIPNGNSISDCLDSEGTLNENVDLINVGDDGLVSLLWNKGININRYITCNTSSILVDLGDINVDIKGIFLVDNSTGYVIAYNIQDKSIHINKEQAVFPLSGMLCSVHTGVEQ